MQRQQAANDEVGREFVVAFSSLKIEIEEQEGELSVQERQAVAVKSTWRRQVPPSWRWPGS